MKMKRTLKKSYKILYFTIITLLIIIGIFLTLLYTNKKTTPPPAQPLTGFVLNDGSVMLLGNEYSVGILSADCNKDVLTSQAFHYIRSYDALILLGTGENVTESASAIMAAYPVSNLLVSKKTDKAFLETVKESYPSTVIQKLGSSKNILLGDMLLEVKRAGSKLNLLLTHGQENILIASEHFSFKEPLSYVIAPTSVLYDCKFHSDYLISTGDTGADVLQLSALSDNRYSPSENVLSFFTDGQGITFVE